MDKQLQNQYIILILRSYVICVGKVIFGVGNTEIIFMIYDRL